MSGRSLRFTELRVDRLPGVPPGGGFVLRDLSPDVTLVHGPNGTGKTISGRALLDLVWPRGGDPRGRHVAGGWELDGATWSVQLDGSHVTWRRDGAEVEPPALPPPELRPHHWLGLRELLVDDGPDDERPDAFARRIAREMLGDYDLDAAVDALELSPSPSRPRTLRRTFDERRARLAEAGDAARDGHADGERLDELTRRHEAAIEAERTASRLVRALERRELVDRLTAVEAAIANAPPGLDRLAGDEAERIAAARSERAARQAEAEAATDRQAEAEATAAATRLPEGGVPDGTLGAIEEDVEAIAAAGRDLEEIDEQLAEAAAGARAARAAVADGGAEGVDDAALTRLGPVVPESLARHATDRATLRGERAEAEARMRRAEAAARAADEETARVGARLEDLRRGRDALAAWLAAPSSAGAAEPGDDAGAGAGGARWAGPVAAGLAAALAVVLAVLAHPAWAAAGLVAIVLAVLGWRGAVAGGRAAPVPARDERAERADEVRRLELPEPEAWDPAPVRRALDALLRRIVGAERAEADRVAAADRLAEARDRLAQLEADAARLDAERAELERSLGLAIDPGRSDWLAVLGENLAAWQAARRRQVELEARRETIVARRAARAAALAGRLRPYEGATADADPGGSQDDAATDPAAAADDGLAAAVLDPAAARGRLRELRARSDARRRADADAASASRERDRAQAELERLDEAIAAVFIAAELEPGDDAGLARRLEARPADAEQRQRARDLRGQIDAIERELGEDAAELELDADVLRARLDAARREASARDELADEIGRIRERVDAARRGRDVEEAAHAVDAARDELREAGERAEAAMVGHAVAEWLRAEAAERSRPAVLRAAADHFRRITHGRYELEVSGEGGAAVFMARDARDELRKRLDELSAGERVQLLLSVRLGFLEQAEGGLRIPIVLDEILGTTDDERAAAIIDAVVEICRHGRQVISFTAQPDELGKWRARLAGEPDVELREIDLARVRRFAEAESTPLPIDPPAAPVVPAPHGDDHETYGRRLDVPGLRPAGPAGAVHLWHVIDEPVVLHRLLERGIRQVGPLRTLARAGTASGPLADLPREAIRAAEARAVAIGAAFAAWRVGRGTPVDRAALEASGAVSDTFIDRVAAQAAACDGDAAALLAALEQKAVAGFRQRKIEELRASLEASGHLDPDPRLGADGILHRVLAAAGAEVSAGRLDPAWIHRMIASLPDVPPETPPASARGAEVPEDTAGAGP